MHQGHDNNLWLYNLYCNKTWLKVLKVKTWAHAGPLHQGPWKASYAPASYVTKCSLIQWLRGAWEPVQRQIHANYHWLIPFHKSLSFPPLYPSPSGNQKRKGRDGGREGRREGGRGVETPLGRAAIYFLLRLNHLLYLSGFAWSLRRIHLFTHYYATAQDCSRIDRFIKRTVNLGYLPADCQTFNSLVNTAEDRLLLLRYSQIIPRSPPALPPYPHQTAWPPQASSSIYPTLKRWQAMYSPCPII